MNKRNCAALIKAIDAYIAKADSELEDILSDAGFINVDELMGEVISLEDSVARALIGQTRYIRSRLDSAVDLAAFAAEWPEIKEFDNVDDVLAQLFYDNFTTSMPKLAEAYIKKIDPALTVATISKRTTAWVESWSEELADLMKLPTHETIERLLVENLNKGRNVADLTLDIMGYQRDADGRIKRDENGIAIREGGIRDEYFRARRVALTETMRAHSVAQQEAIMQNPACEEKEWVHTGGYRTVPRENHVEMSGQKVGKDEPFTLIGADGNTYYPMYPRDSELPASESVNCHCIHRGIASEDVLGLTLEEREALQAEAIADDDGTWEKELDAQNRARAGIDETLYKPSKSQYNEVYRDIRDNFSHDLNQGQQDKHVVGTNNYIEGRSILTADAGMLLDKYQGNGRLQFSQSGKWTNKEAFTHTEVIGTWVSRDGAQSLETTSGMIHYGKRNGMHIVPARPEKED